MPYNDGRKNMIVRTEIINAKVSDRLAPRLQEDHEDGDMGIGHQGPAQGTLTQAKTKTKKPSMYKVIMLNDDYTPMEFVVHVLQKFFRMDMSQATTVMLHVHQRGVGICGVYTYEVAETKVTQVVDYARKNQHPLQLTLEKE